MHKKRIIARIDIKNEYAIKGIQLEGLRKIGDPNILAKKYYDGGIDEVFFMDAVAAYYDRNSLSRIIESACKDIFIPITVGGGIRTVADIQKALNAGADKVAINTQAIRNPSFIREASRVFGSQCIVSSVDVKKMDKPSMRWEVYFDNGREPTGIDALYWVKKVEELGAGEIMVTSVDMEGTKKGFDEDIVNSICSAVSIPVIASGGAGNVEHIVSLFRNADVDAVALASILHYGLCDIKNVKSRLFSEEIRVKL